MIDTYGVPVPGLPAAPVTVVIPTHPARGGALERGTLLGRAVASVRAQTLQPAGGISIACDLNGDGAGATRQRALDEVDTEFASFLDSDDTFYPNHLETHYRLLRENDADVAYSWFDGNLVFPAHRGRVWDPAEPHHTTMTITVRTELAKRVGFATDHPEGWIVPQEDWRMILGLNNLGAKFVGTGEITWTYQVTGFNTSGSPTNGDGPLSVRR